MSSQKSTSFQNFPQSKIDGYKQLIHRSRPILDRFKEGFRDTARSLRSSPFPILIQITVPYMVLAILVAALGTYLISRVVIDSVQERFTNQLLETGFLADDGIVRHEEDLLENLRLITHIQGVDLAAQTHNVRALRELALPPAINAKVEAIAMVDPRGAAIISLALDAETQTYYNMVPATSYVANAFLQKVLAGEVDAQGDKFTGVVGTSAGPFLFVASPIQDVEGRLVGAALVGESLNSVVRHLREETLGQLTIYDRQGQPLSSTLQTPVGLDASQVQFVFERQAEGSVERPLSDSGLSYSELLIPFEVRGGQDLGLMGVALPTTLLVQTSSVTRGNTFALMTVMLLLVMAVGAIVARRISQPILDLKEAAVRVTAGDLKVKVTPKGKDEVGILAQSFNEMVDGLAKSKQDLLDAYDKTIEGWSRALDLRDHETEGHSRRVTQLAMDLGKAMGLSADQLGQLHRGGLLHDIGKIGIPDSILLKEGKLTAEELAQVHRHPEYAKSFMEQIEFLQPALVVPYSHHERWDGTGYPQGLKGEQIPLLARLFAVADVWDAITSERSYRRAMSFADALETIRSESGKHFDPRVVAVFNALISQKSKGKQERVAK